MIHTGYATLPSLPLSVRGPRGRLTDRADSDANRPPKICRSCDVSETPEWLTLAGLGIGSRSGPSARFAEAAVRQRISASIRDLRSTEYSVRPVVASPAVPAAPAGRWT